MRQHLKYLVMAVLFAVALSGCGVGSASRSDAFLVVTTIYPLDYFATRIGGEDADVNLLIGPGTEAHAFEPTSSDVLRIAEAQLVVANGLSLEPWLGRVIEGLSEEERPVVLEASDIAGLEGHDAEDGHDHETDPHVWLDPVLAKAQAERVRDAMSEADSQHARGYAMRAQALIDDLVALDHEYTTGLSGCAQDTFVTTHAAYGYMAERYGLHQVSIAGLSPEAEPTPRDLANLTEQIKELGVKYVLVEPSLSARLAETVAAEGHLELLPIHQMESVTEQELSEHGDYLGLMRDNLHSLEVALECVG